jgi:predicted DNA-binding transcriptional regulator AlpA
MATNDLFGPEKITVMPAKSIAPLTVGLKDAARLLGISERSLWGMANRGEVPCVRLGGRLVFRVGSLDEWLVEREKAGNRSPATIP